MKIQNEVYVNDIDPADIPEIELYIDQIITLFNRIETDEEKYLTKSMINNYSKAKIIEKIKGRKYSRAHIIVIAIINRLKQTLTINEIKAVMDNAKDIILNEIGEYNLDVLLKIYNSYREIFTKSSANYDKMIPMLEEFEKHADEKEFYIVEALCFSALSQNYGNRVKNMVKDIAEK